MKPPVFSFVAPETLDECIALLNEYQDDAKIIAGGQSLMPLLNLRMAAPTVVVDVSRIAELNEGTYADGKAVISAMVRQRVLEKDTELRKHLPLLANAIEFIGHVATRSRGTIVGSMCHADPAAELPVCATLLGAEYVLASSEGTRTINADEFFVDAMTTSIEPNEIVTSVRLPMAIARTGYAFDEVSRRRGDFAMVCAAGMITASRDGNMVAGSVAIGGMAGRPMLIAIDEDSIKGHVATGFDFSDIASALSYTLETESDLHASAEYRKSIAAVLIKRVLEKAATKCFEEPKQ